MAHELLRSRLKLPDRLAGRTGRDEASSALEMLVRLTAHEIEDMFSPYERECLPQWAQEGIAFALQQAQRHRSIRVSGAAVGQRVVEAGKLQRRALHVVPFETSSA